MFLLYSINYYGELVIHGLFLTNEDAKQNGLKHFFLDIDEIHIKNLNENKFEKDGWNGIQEKCIDCGFCEIRNADKYNEFLYKTI
jgi:hypothetical protein